MTTKHKKTFNYKAVILFGIAAIVILLIIARASRVSGAIVNDDNNHAREFLYMEDQEMMYEGEDYSDQQSIEDSQKDKSDNKDRVPASDEDYFNEDVERKMEFYDTKPIYDRRYK